MRSSEKALWERLEEVIKAVKALVDIPVIVNGDVFQWSDIEKVKKLTSK
jgi:tRNA-dihydrouridine synthase 2